MKFIISTLLIATTLAQFETCKNTNLPSVKDCTPIGSYFEAKKYTLETHKSGKFQTINYTVKGKLLNPIHKGSWSVSNTVEGSDNFKVYNVCEFNACPILPADNIELKFKYNYEFKGAKETEVNIRLVSPQSFVYLNSAKLIIKN